MIDLGANRQAAAIAPVGTAGATTVILYSGRGFILDAGKYVRIAVQGE